MIMPLPVWNMAYSASRRGRRHRCNGCNKVVGEGDAVVMARVSDKTTRAMHEVCAARPMGGSTFTGLEFLTAWGMEHLAKVGYGEAKSFVDFRSHLPDPQGGRENMRGDFLAIERRPTGRRRMNIVRDNLMNRQGYTPYCGNPTCSHTMPRTAYRAGQFHCRCGWSSSFDRDFIVAYEARWAGNEAVSSSLEPSGRG